MDFVAVKHVTKDVKTIKGRKIFSRILCFVILFCLLSANFNASAQQTAGTEITANPSDEIYLQNLEQKYGFEIIIDDSILDKQSAPFYAYPKVVDDVELQVLKDIENTFVMLPDGFVKEVSDLTKSLGYLPSINIRKQTDAEKSDSDAGNYVGWFDMQNASINIVADGDEFVSVLMHEFGHEVAFILDENNSAGFDNIKKYFVIQNKDYTYQDDNNYSGNNNYINYKTPGSDFYDFFLADDASLNFGEDFASAFAYAVLQPAYISSYGIGFIKPIHNKIKMLSETLRNTFESLKNTDFLLNCLPEKPSAWAVDTVKQAKEKNIIPWNIYGLNREDLTKYDAALMLKQLLYKFIPENELLAKSGIKKDAEIPENSVYGTPDEENILLLNNLNVLTLDSYGEFDPKGKISRQYAAQLLTQTALILGIGVDDFTGAAGLKLRYNDAYKISSGAENYIKFVTYLKIINGDDKNNFYPERYITYEEFYSALLNLCNLKEEYNKKNNLTPPPDYSQVLGAGTAVSENGWICCSPFSSVAELQKFTGRGRMAYDGYIYDGLWQDGQWNGSGTIEWSSGGVYRGGFVGGKITGRGRITWTDGEWYEGDFVDSAITGSGKMTYIGGSVYDGDWDNGIWTGLGKIVWADGTIYEGNFKDGIYDGKGVMKWTDGSWYSGDWQNGERTGKGEYVSPIGAVFEGNFVNGAYMGK
ncbi:MAG: S-layer homology domain-containing protein [Oscillospiraceae bacterium]|nr:S-layer homology domain-containing protein [Oscillospiraceae bacterium]